MKKTAKVKTTQYKSIGTRMVINTKGKNDIITSVTIRGIRIPSKALYELAPFLQKHVLGN